MPIQIPELEKKLPATLQAALHQDQNDIALGDLATLLDQADPTQWAILTNQYELYRSENATQKNPPTPDRA